MHASKQRWCINCRSAQLNCLAPTVEVGAPTSEVAEALLRVDSCSKECNLVQKPNLFYVFPRFPYQTFTYQALESSYADLYGISRMSFSRLRTRGFGTYEWHSHIEHEFRVCQVVNFNLTNRYHHDDDQTSDRPTRCMSITRAMTTHMWSLFLAPYTCCRARQVKRNNIVFTTAKTSLRLHAHTTIQCSHLTSCPE